MWAPAKTFIYTKLKGGDICLCPKLGQLPYIRRKVANVSVLIPSWQKLITSKTNIPGHPAVPGSTQGSLYSPRLVAASNAMNCCPAEMEKYLKTPFELFPFHSGWFFQYDYFCLKGEKKKDKSKQRESSVAPEAWAGLLTFCLSPVFYNHELLFILTTACLDVWEQWNRKYVAVP